MINSPRLFDAAVQLVRAGIPLRSILAMSWELEAAFDRMAFGFVQLVRGGLPEHRVGDPSPDELDRLAELVRRLRPSPGRSPTSISPARWIAASVGTFRRSSSTSGLRAGNIPYRIPAGLLYSRPMVPA